MTDKTAPAPASPVDLEQLVAEADIGGRNPAGVAAKAIMIVAVSWSLFQLWYASPLPFMVGFGVFSDTEARCFHLSFALFLAFASYPALASSPRNRIPLTDLALAAVAIACVLYLVVFYRALVLRPGLPTFADIAVSVVGVVLLIEASRRAEGPWMPVISLSMLAYVFLGPHLPGLLSHKGSSVGRAASHFWITSEGVFGVALGVSTQFISVSDDGSTPVIVERIVTGAGGIPRHSFSWRCPECGSQFPGFKAVLASAASGPIAGVYTRASMPPRSAAALPMADETDEGSVTSHSMASAPAPASSAAASSRSRRRARRATCAPRCPRPTPMQRPSPLDAPTTTARMRTFPVDWY